MADKHREKSQKPQSIEVRERNSGRTVHQWGAEATLGRVPAGKSRAPPRRESGGNRQNAETTRMFSFDLEWALRRAATDRPTDRP